MKNLTLVLMLFAGFALAAEALGQPPASPPGVGGIAEPPRYVSPSERAEPYGVVDRPGRPPVITGGAEDVSARNALLGLWQVTYLEQDGDANPALASTLWMRFHRGKLELMQFGEPVKKVTYKLAANHYPRHFWWYVHSGGCIFLQRGVYWLDDDKLLLCVASVNERRATEFLTHPGDGRTLFVLQRVQDGS